MRDAAAINKKYLGANGTNTVPGNNQYCAVHHFFVYCAWSSELRPESNGFSLTRYPGTFKLGASGTLPVFAEDRWWTLITANYLHGSLLHLLFNVSALRAVGKINIEIYAPSRLFLIYFLGGLFSMAVSSLAGIPLTLGASGAVCALIGSMSYDEWRASKGNLKMRIASVGIWVALIAITGLALPYVNNWAHAVGFVSGFILGFLFWPQTPQSEIKTFRAAATSCMLLTIGALIYGLLFS